MQKVYLKAKSIIFGGYLIFYEGQNKPGYLAMCTQKIVIYHIFYPQVS